MLVVVLAGCLTPVQAQVRTVALGAGGATWVSGGGSVEPVRLASGTRRARLDTGNVPDGDIELGEPGWINPRFFDGQTNIADLVLRDDGRISAPNSLSVDPLLLRIMLEGLVNGDHDTAFERKPTPFQPQVYPFGVWLHLDFGRQVGVERVRFYPRNTVVPTPDTPFQDDYLRGYEVWVNPVLTNRVDGDPDILVTRVAENDDPVVVTRVPAQYVRVLKLRSLSSVPFEIDEIEVYGTGYLSQGTYYSDIIDLGDRSTIGPVQWRQVTVGEAAFSELTVRVRTGDDDTPIAFLERSFLQDGTPAPREVTPEAYDELSLQEQLGIVHDEINWSPWRPLESGDLPPVRVPRRWIQLQVQFEGRLFDTRRVNRLWFQHLQPPLADTLRAEVFPRLADSEEPATFRYAVRLRGGPDVRGYNQLEVDTNVEVERIRNVTLNGTPIAVEVLESSDSVFRLGLPHIGDDGDLLAFTFDLPVFRFGTTFSARVIHTDFPALPQTVDAGQATDFGPGDDDDLSGLFVSIPKREIGRLVGEVTLSSPVITPNGDGVNDELSVVFNLLQLVAPAPVVFDVHDLGGRRVARVRLPERGIGPAQLRWNGGDAAGVPLAPGHYVWVLRVLADAFEERHTGALGVAY